MITRVGPRYRSPVTRGTIRRNGPSILFSLVLALVLFVATADASAATALLGFPVAGENPYTAPIISVLDHSARTFYDSSHTQVEGYTGELGSGGCGPSGEPCGHYNDAGSPFRINGHYTGNNGPTGDGGDATKVLNYRGHSGYDFGYGPGTPIVAAADGILRVPATDMINDPRGSDPWCTYHTFYIDHGNGITTWYLHADHLTGGTPHSCPSGTGSNIPADETIDTVVHKGDQVAVVGDFANGEPGDVGYHLHFEARSGCRFQAGEIQECKVIDPYGWEWLDTDPFADGAYNPLAAFQSGPMWDLPSLGLTLPVATKVALQTVGGGFRATITGGNFSAGALVTLWNRRDQTFVDSASPSSLTGTQIDVQLPASDVIDPDNVVLKIENASGPRSHGVALSGHGAANDHTVLILGRSVDGGANSIEAIEAASLGATVEIASDNDWSAKSTADFATYRAIILGDPRCTAHDPSPVSAAVTTADTWGPAITGNVVLIGTDPVFHYRKGGVAGGETLTAKGIAFALAESGKTGAYVTLSCYYGDKGFGASPRTPVPLLDAFEPGGFTVDGTAGEVCYNDAHIVAAHPALEGLSDAGLSNWSCSVHEAFDQFPADFLALAVARNLGSSFTGPDGTIGTPYILARGPRLLALGLSLTTASPVSDVGSTATVLARQVDPITGTPIGGVLIGFLITDGPNAGIASGGLVPTGTCVPADCRTDSDGTVTFTYLGGGGAGTDSVLAFVDANASGLSDIGEPQTTTVVDWRAGAPISTPTPATGGSCIENHPGAVRCDDFNSGAIDSTNWIPRIVGTGPTSSQTNRRLEVTLPAGSSSSASAPYFGAVYDSTCKLDGDFDIQVDFQLLDWPPAGGVRVGILVADATAAYGLFPFGAAHVSRVSQGGESYRTFEEGVGIGGDIRTSDMSGSLRLVRTGDTLRAYHADPAGWVLIGSDAVSAQLLRVSIGAWSSGVTFGGQQAKVALDNFVINSGTLVCGQLPTPAPSPCACSQTDFDEPFDGDTLDSTRWQVATNGYPEPAVTVAGGFVRVGQPGISSADLPYVTSATDMFPGDGDFELEVGAQYTSLGGNGDGFGVIGAGNEFIFRFWQGLGSPAGLHVDLRDAFASVPGDRLGFHVYRLQVVGGQAHVFVDGSLLLTRPLPVRPARLWFGHATVGQVQGWGGSGHAGSLLEGLIDPATGVYLWRRWPSQSWSTFQLDSIRVRRSCACAAALRVAHEPCSGNPVHVGGPICNDSVWRQIDSPFFVDNSISIGGSNCGGAVPTLTIEPGVEVCVSDAKAIEVGGGLVARGSSPAPILFTSVDAPKKPGAWQGIHFTDTATDAAFDSNGNFTGGSILENAVVEYAGDPAGTGVVAVSSSAPYLRALTIRESSAQTAVLGLDAKEALRVDAPGIVSNVGGRGGTPAGIRVFPGTMASITHAFVANNATSGISCLGSSCQIDNSVVFANALDGVSMSSGSSSLSASIVENNAGTGVRGSGFTLQDSSVIQNAGWGVELSGGVAQRNCIARNTGTDGAGRGLRVLSGATTVTSNTITGQAGTAVYIATSGGVQLTGNNLEGNGTYALHYDRPSGSPDLNATGNWWGGTDSDAVSGRILDFYKRGTLAKVIYNTPAPAPPPSAPLQGGCAPCLDANVPADHWKGEYWNNEFLSGPAHMIRDDGSGELNVDFGADRLGSPGLMCGISNDFISARWTRTVLFPQAGVYRFIVHQDDGFRLYIDGVSVNGLNQWHPWDDRSPYVVDLVLEAGTHELRAEWYEIGVFAVATLSWQRVSPTPSATPTATATVTLAYTSTRTATPTATRTPSPSPTATSTSTATASPTCAAVSVSVGCADVLPADSPVTVNVTIDAGPHTLGSYAVDLQWDPSLLQFDGSAPGTAPEFSLASPCSSLGEGRARCAAFQNDRLDGPTGLVNVARLRMVTRGPASRSGHITATLSSFFDTHGLGLQPCQDGDLCAVTTQACGDVNSDRAVNIGDAQLAAQLDVGLRQCSEPPLVAAVCDVNRDAHCNVGDALAIAQCDRLLRSCTFQCGEFSCETPAIKAVRQADRAPSGSEVGVRILPPSGSQAPGTTFVRDLVIESGTIPLGAYSVSIACDPDVLEVVGPVAGGTAPEFSAAPTQTVSGCRINLAAFQASHLEGPVGTVGVARLTFRVKDDARAGSSTITVKVNSVYGTDTQLVAAASENGEIMVEPPAMKPTASATPTVTTVSPAATPTATPSSSRCAGDCDASGDVTVSELITIVNIALGNSDVSLCRSSDTNGDGRITIDEILTTVNNALDRCG